MGWMALIFLVSDQPGLPQLLPAESRDPVTTALHFLEYVALGALLFRACLPDRQAALPLQKPHSFRMLLALWTVAALFGATDEFHQSFVPNRTASVVDWAVDTSGALAGLATYYFWKTRASRRRARPFNKTAP